LPPSWTRATEPLTPKLDDPRERLAVGTFPLRYRATNCEAFAGSAQQDLGPRDVFLILLERGDPTNERYGDLPARPAKFGPTTGDAPEPTDCPNSNAEIQWIEFSDARRNFMVLIAFGRGASDDTRTLAYRILDTLEFDPQIQPDWPASP